MQNLIELESQWIAQGYAVVDQFLTPTTITQLRELADFYQNSGAFSDAKIGVGENQSLHQSIRGDQTLWLENTFHHPAIATYLSSMAALKDHFNQWLFAGLVDIECHFAKYPVGSFYKKHYDRFEAQDTRVISSVLYMNPTDWKKEDGGCLAIYPNGQAVEITPLPGRLVLFDSADLLHEVLPATRERYSMTGWFLRRDLQKMELTEPLLNKYPPEFEKGSLWGAPIKPVTPTIPPKVA